MYMQVYYSDIEACNMCSEDILRLSTIKRFPSQTASKQPAVDERHKVQTPKLSECAYVLTHLRIYMKVYRGFIAHDTNHSQTWNIVVTNTAI